MFLGKECSVKMEVQRFSWYFRDAVVRANYRNPSKGIGPDKLFLAKFFRNLMLGEHHELSNRADCNSDKQESVGDLREMRGFSNFAPLPTFFR